MINNDDVVDGNNYDSAIKNNIHSNDNNNSNNNK